MFACKFNEDTKIYLEEPYDQMLIEYAFLYLEKIYMEVTMVNANGLELWRLAQNTLAETKKNNK